MSGLTPDDVIGLDAPVAGVVFHLALVCQCPHAEETDHHAVRIDLPAGVHTIEAGALVRWFAEYADRKITAEALVAELSAELTRVLKEAGGAEDEPVYVGTKVEVAGGEVELTTGV